MKKTMYIAAVATAMVVGANAALISNGDWESTQNIAWISHTADTMADLNGWYSSAKAGVFDGAYVEPVSGYGTGNVGAMKATSAVNYFQQTLLGVDAGIGEITVNYDGGIRWHSTYSTAARDITLRVSIWDVTADTELTGTDVVTAYANTAANKVLHARSHILSYDATGLAGHALAVRFENTTPQASGAFSGSAVLLDNVEAIPEPATLGMVALFGGGIFFLRRKLAM